MSGIVVKSDTDRKVYDFVKLPCGIEACLVSTLALVKNPQQTPSAAAALSVQVGSFCDPPNAEGCAHFLEHMVFMGSEKYPEENAYDSFVSSNGGYCNAFTESEYTVYQFEVQPEAFEGALDRFANCFKAPLLAVGAMDREVQAIENEFNLALNDDESRLQQMLSHHALPGHPYGIFSWGNRRSLKDIPEAKGVKMNCVLKEFHSRYYYPSNMRLSVVAPLSIEELRAAVLRCFEWPGDRLGPTAPHFVNPSLEYKPSLPPCALGKVSKIASRKKGHRMYLNWQLPPLLRLQDSKPGAYLAHLVGHEGPGSLMAHLQAHSLAQGLVAGVSDGGLESSSLCSLFTVSVKLTKKGLANWPLVAQRVLQYLEMVKEDGIQQWVFEEIKDMAHVSFRFADDEEAPEVAEGLAINMLPLFACKREDLLRTAYVYEEWRPDLIRELLIDHMQARQMRVDLVSSSYKGDAEDGDFEGADGEDSDVGSDGEEEDDEDDKDDDDDGSEESDEEESDNDDEAGLVVAECTPLLEVLPLEPVLWVEELEPHFKVTAASVQLPEALFALWKQSCDQTSWAPLFSLPPRNPFIPRSLALHASAASLPHPDEPPSKRACTDGAMPPVPHVNASPGDGQSGIDLIPTALVTGAEGHRLLFSLDQRLEQPKVALNFQICSAHFHSSPLAGALLDLLLLVARDALTPVLYLASLADLDCQMINQSGSLTMRIAGFDDKAWVLADQVLQAILSRGGRKGASGGLRCLEEDIFTDPARLVRCRDALIEKYNNDLLTASKASSRSMAAALISSAQHQTERLTALEALQPTQLTAAKLGRYMADSLAGASVQCLVQGNAKQDEAVAGFEALVASLPTTIHATAVPANCTPAALAAATGKAKCFALHTVPNSATERNIAVEVYFYIGEYSSLAACQWYLLETCLGEPFFDQLRTKEQLGYEVSASVDEVYGSFYMCFKVVSATHSMTAVIERVLGFAAAAPDLVRALDDDHVRLKVYPALLQSRQSPDLTVRDASDRAWKRVLDRTFVFNRREQQVAVLTQQQAALCDQRALAEATLPCLRSCPKFVMSLSSLTPPSEKEVRTIVQRVYKGCEVQVCKSFAEAKTALGGLKQPKQAAPPKQTKQPVQPKQPVTNKGGKGGKDGRQK